MHIFIYGPPATGKSTIGKLLASDLKMPFIDLDAMVEAKAGDSISNIIKLQGEPAFRDLEAAALKSLSHEDAAVVALGGGTLLREGNRTLAESIGKVLLLTASVPTLLKRLHGDRNKRPLLQGDLSEKLSTLLQNRARHYTAFPLSINVDGSTPRQLVQRARVILGRHHLSAMGDYDALVAPLSALEDFPLQNPIVVTDENVARHHLEKLLSVLKVISLTPKYVILPPGEDHKTLDTIAALWNSFLQNGLDRKSTVIALGGGVIGDLAGFAAATYMRGINWVGVPTTLLGMVDSSLGGKTGFDLPQAKNLVGAFHPPRLVLADPQLLSTLPERELRSGMAEVVKHGIISDPGLFEICGRQLDWTPASLEDVVKRAMAVKIRVIEQDPYEKGIRAALNLGHTVGHAVELVSRFSLRHGEAIAIGMAVEARYAAKIGLADQSVVVAIQKTLASLDLPTQIPSDLPHEELLRAMRLDKKKHAAAIRFALPAEIGRVELVDVIDLADVLE